MAYRGSTKLTPERGIGYGAGIGVLAARRAGDASARHIIAHAAHRSRGQLGRAHRRSRGQPALARARERERSAQSLWLASIATGTVIGAGVGWLSTRGSSRPEKGATTLPYFAMEPADPTRGTRSFMSLGVQGTW